MTIHIYTNLVFGGWTAADIETGIGGSEESLIQFAKAMTERKHEVTIYHNGIHGVFDNVKYSDHREFKPFEYRDVFISFKAKNILEQSINAKKVFHLTTEIESWTDTELRDIDGVVTISNYHNDKISNSNRKIFPIYLGIDTKRMDLAKTDKVKGTAIYTSSYDRGLEELLIRWPELKNKLKLTTLWITYGWDFMERGLNSPTGKAWKIKMESLMKQDGIEVLGRLSNNDLCAKYWEAEYWVHPLNKAESELFCLAAVKAQYAGCVPVVRRIGALQETVGQFIDYDNLLKNNKIMKVSPNMINKHASKFTLDIMVKKWEQLITLKS